MRNSPPKILDEIRCFSLSGVFQKFWRLSKELLFFVFAGIDGVLSK